MKSTDSGDVCVNYFINYSLGNYQIEKISLGFVFYGGYVEIYTKNRIKKVTFLFNILPL
jgi:hypothetical protein